MTTPRVLSYGGGLDSFAMLLGAIQRNDKPDAVCFVDVSDGDRDANGIDPGEWPGTYRHIREVVIPLCSVHGIEFYWLSSERYPVRGERSLFAWLKSRNQIPVAGPNRICTRIAKVERFEAWLERMWPSQVVEVWVGFEAGEEDRAKKDPNAGSAKSLRRNRFPLMDWGLCRCRCEKMVRAAGYPVPRKSACVFCPYASKGDWQRFAVELPAQFEKVVELEAAKPPTSKGRKLSIMGYRTKKHPVTKEFISYKAPPLPEFIKGSYRVKTKPCGVCGAAQRATKATGCTYLEEAA